MQDVKTVELAKEDGEGGGTRTTTSRWGEGGRGASGGVVTQTRDKTTDIN
jgi:hypothetical protein